MISRPWRYVCVRARGARYMHAVFASSLFSPEKSITVPRVSVCVYARVRPPLGFHEAHVRRALKFHDMFAKLMSDEFAKMMLGASASLLQNFLFQSFPAAKCVVISVCDNVRTCMLACPSVHELNVHIQESKPPPSSADNAVGRDEVRKRVTKTHWHHASSAHAFSPLRLHPPLSVNAHNKTCNTYMHVHTHAQRSQPQIRNLCVRKSVCVCVFVYAYDMHTHEYVHVCVCVCVWEGERERERESIQTCIYKCTWMHLFIYILVCIYLRTMTRNGCENGKNFSRKSVWN